MIGPCTKRVKGVQHIRQAEGQFARHIFLLRHFLLEDIVFPTVQDPDFFVIGNPAGGYNIPRSFEDDGRIEQRGIDHRSIKVFVGHSRLLYNLAGPCRGDFSGYGAAIPASSPRVFAASF